MRRALLIPIGLGLVLAPGRASAEPPHVELRLEYARGSGGEACPAEPTTLRAEVAARMGYDPFEGANASERLAVVMVGKDRGFAARVERFNAAGVSTWSATFPTRPLRGDCAAVMSPLASYLRGMVLPYQGGPAPTLATPPPEPPAPAPTPPPVVVAPLAPTARPSKPPEPPDVPNPSRALATRVAIVSYAAAGVFLGLAIGWTVDAQNKRNDAQTLGAQLNPASANGDSACYYSGAPPGSYCARVLSAWQARDAAVGLRNGWYIGAGVSAAVGIAATVWAVNLPTVIKGPVRAQVMFKPGGVALSGTF